MKLSIETGYEISQVNIYCMGQYILKSWNIEILIFRHKTNILYIVYL